MARVNGGTVNDDVIRRAAEDERAAAEVAMAGVFDHGVVQVFLAHAVVLHR